MWLGNYPTNFTKVVVPLTTSAADGSPVAPSSAFETADFKLYKDGSATERTSQAGWTIQSPHDSLTGAHVLILDLSDNTDAGFYAANHVYTVLLDPDETVGGVAVRRFVGQFGIDLGSAFAALADIQARLPAALVSGRMSSDAVAISGSTTAADNVEANIGHLDADVSGVAAAVWAVVVDGTRTAIQLMRGFTAALLGKSSGLNVGTPTYRNIADSKDVITASSDADGNRSSVTLDLT